MLRRITSKDLENVYNLGNLYDSRFREKYNLEEYLDNNIYVMNLDEKDGIITGFIIGTLMEKTAEILLIYVDEKYRGQKIGKALLRSVEDKAEEIILEVSKNNVVALNLYNKSGYQIISTRQGYYNGIDALVMKKVLK